MRYALIVTGAAIRFKLNFFFVVFLAYSLGKIEFLAINRLVNHKKQAPLRIRPPRRS